MFLSNDTLALILDLKSKIKRWRSAAILFVVIALIFISAGVSSKSPKSKRNPLNIAKSCIGRVEISGVITADSHRDKILEKIKDEDKIKALIIDVDSPGGGVAESENLYEAFKDISKKKPIVVVMKGRAASGAYMLSLASKHIIARNGTITGSIGVLLQGFEATELAKKVGIKFLTYKSSELKGAPSPFEKTNDRIDESVQSSINDIYEFFVELVARRRQIGIDMARKISNGQVYTGRQALELGLIDQIGGEREALSYLRARGINTKVLEVEDIDLKKPIGEFGWMDRIFGSFLNSNRGVISNTEGIWAIQKF